MELVVIIVILFVLIGILTPVVTASVASSKRAACQENLHQIGAALLLYAADNNDTLPPYDAWRSRAAPLPTSPLMHCPSVDPKQADTGYPGYAYSTATLGAVSNPAFSSVGVPLARAKHPAQTVLVAETIPAVDLIGMVPANVSVNEDDNKDCTVGCVGENDHKSHLMDTMAGSTRHQGGVSYLFFDSHVKWYTPEQFVSEQRHEPPLLTFSL